MATTTIAEEMDKLITAGDLFTARRIGLKYIKDNISYDQRVIYLLAAISYSLGRYYEAHYWITNHDDKNADGHKNLAGLIYTKLPLGQ